MPVYEYECRDCGSFEAFRLLESRNEPVHCPWCATLAARVLSTPHLAIMNPAARKAHSINEKSQHEPRVSTRHTCSSGCGCGRPSSKGRARGDGGSGASPAGERPLRKKRKTPARPWMLGH